MIPPKRPPWTIPKFGGKLFGYDIFVTYPVDFDYVFVPNRPPTLLVSNIEGWLANGETIEVLLGSEVLWGANNPPKRGEVVVVP